MRALRAAVADLPDAAHADLLESDEAYLVVVDVPGATAGSIELDAGDGRLGVRAGRGGVAPEEFEYVERSREPELSFELPLPPDADPAGATAGVERGVLEVRIPRDAEPGATIPLDGE